MHDVLAGLTLPTLARAQTKPAWAAQVPVIRIGLLGGENDADRLARYDPYRKLLETTLRENKDVEARVHQLHDFEHKGDDMTHAILTKLNQTFITPFDREDIHRLASSLDDVLDFVYAAGERLVPCAESKRSGAASSRPT